MRRYSRGIIKRKRKFMFGLENASSTETYTQSWILSQIDGGRKASIIKLLIGGHYN